MIFRISAMHVVHLLTLMCLLAVATTTATVAAQGIDVVTPVITAAPWDDQQVPWARTIERIVKADGVDYRSLRRDHAELDQYVAQLAHAPEPSDTSEKLAFYINAYNACTLHVVNLLLPDDATQWPQWSIAVAGTPPGTVWKGYRFEIAGRRLTLDAIEHQILRPLGDPRMHLAINCASRSCPALAPIPYRATTLNAQLDAAAHAFVMDSQQLRLHDGALLINPILSWFGDDFKTLGGVRVFLRTQAEAVEKIKPHSAEPLITYLSGTAALQFFTYDWRLNIIAEPGDKKP